MSIVWKWVISVGKWRARIGGRMAGERPYGTEGRPYVQEERPYVTY